MKSLILHSDELRSLLDSGQCEVRRPDGVVLKPIPIAPNDDYMAGSDGRIYSRTRFAGFGRKEYVEWYPLKGHKSTRGYPSVSLCHNNRKITKTVHRLVCMAFHGLPESASTQVRHLDGSRDNNRPENLVWGTQWENWADRRAHGRAKDRGEHPFSKFTNEERSHIQWAVVHGLCSGRHAASVLGVSQRAIRGIVERG